MPKEIEPKIFSVGRRVLAGMGRRPGTVQSVADAPSTMGEYLHMVILDSHPDLPQKFVGCDIRPIPRADADLPQANQQSAINIHNSNVANLNFGSQVGTINANLQTISGGDATQQEFVSAIKQLTEAVLQATLPAAEQREVVEALSNIAEQSAKKPEERSKVSLKSLVHYIPTVISSVSSLANLWTKYEPVIKAHLGI
jgi:hypothetical protein